MIQHCSHVFVFSLLIFDLTLCASFQEYRRFIISSMHFGHKDCQEGEEWQCIPYTLFCSCQPKHECPHGTERQCHFSQYIGDDPCPCLPTQEQAATTPIPTKCTVDVNCTGFNCPSQQYPFCEPNLEWSACGCTECTDDHHCSCQTGMIGHCRDDMFERKCECQQLPRATCKVDSDCSTHLCTGNLSQSFCHEKKFLVYDFSSCDCRECSNDSDCHCRSGLIPRCQISEFGNTCYCNQVTGSSIVHTTSTHSSHSTPIRTTSVVKTTSPTTTTTTTTINTPTQTTKAATTSTKITPVVSSNPLHESTTQPTHMTSIEVTKSPTDATTDSSQTHQSTKTTIPENNTSLIMVTLTTKPPDVRKCHICGDSPNSIPCDTRAIYMGNPQACAPGENFCMTDLIHNGQTFPSIYKRCVTEEECRNKWLHQTSDLEHCTNYGNVLVEGHYSCHFCCTSDGCNSKQIPDKSTLYIKA